MAYELAIGWGLYSNPVWRSNSWCLWPDGVQTGLYAALGTALELMNRVFSQILWVSICVVKSVTKPHYGSGFSVLASGMELGKLNDEDRTSENSEKSASSLPGSVELPTSPDVQSLPRLSGEGSCTHALFQLFLPYCKALGLQCNSCPKALSCYRYLLAAEWLSHSSVLKTTS